MIKIDITKINKYPSFVTRQGKKVKLIKYVPKALEKAKLLFLLEDKVLECDEEGKCWSVNGVDSSATESSYSAFDVFVDRNFVGYINLEECDKLSQGNILSECSAFVYRSYEEALKASTEKTFKTVKIEWSV